MMTEEVLCACCGWRTPRTPLVCDICRSRLDRELFELSNLHRLLPYAIERPVSHAEHVSGTREPPVPVNLVALDLVAPGRPGTVLDEYGDQVGTVSISSVLASWVDDWSTTLKIDTLPMLSVSALCSHLRRHLPAATDAHPAIGDFAREVRALVHLAKNLLALETRKTRFQMPCPWCDVPSLIRGSGDEWVQCKNCRKEYTLEELARSAVLELGKQVMTELELPYDLQTGRIDYAEAARLAGVTPSVIRQWKARGHVQPLTPVPGERGPRFRPIDILRAEAITRKKARRVLQNAA